MKAKRKQYTKGNAMKMPEKRKKPISEADKRLISAAEFNAMLIAHDSERRREILEKIRHAVYDTYPEIVEKLEDNRAAGEAIEQVMRLAYDAVMESLVASTVRSPASASEQEKVETENQNQYPETVGELKQRFKGVRAKYLSEIEAPNSETGIDKKELKSLFGLAFDIFAESELAISESVRSQRTKADRLTEITTRDLNAFERQQDDIKAAIKKELEEQLKQLKGTEYGAYIDQMENVVFSALVYTTMDYNSLTPLPETKEEFESRLEKCGNELSEGQLLEGKPAPASVKEAMCAALEEGANMVRLVMSGRHASGAMLQ